MKTPSLQSVSVSQAVTHQKEEGNTELYIFMVLCDSLSGPNKILDL